MLCLPLTDLGPADQVTDTELGRMRDLRDQVNLLRRGYGNPDLAWSNYLVRLSRRVACSPECYAFSDISAVITAALNANRTDMSTTLAGATVSTIIIYSAKVARGASPNRVLEKWTEQDFGSLRLLRESTVRVWGTHLCINEATDRAYYVGVALQV
jgi:hypothetical protein